MDVLREKVQLMLAPYLEAQGFDCIDVKLVKNSYQNLVEVLADKPQGGITIDECAALNPKIRELLDSIKLFDGDYALDVSSPGIDRPLSTAKDFLRFIGKKITVYLSQPVGSRMEYQGMIEKVENNNVYLRYKDRDVEIPLGFINKAQQVI
jgi:ribosome maturation factor RimP